MLEGAIGLGQVALVPVRVVLAPARRTREPAGEKQQEHGGYDDEDDREGRHGGKSMCDHRSAHG